MAEDSVTWEGIDTLQAILRNIRDNTATAVRNEMIDAAYEIFAQSQREVPVRTGALKGSGSVVPEGDEVYIGYGGAAAGYALHVHEDLSSHHKPPTKAKFLEDPANRVLGPIEGRISGKVEGVIMGVLPQAPNTRTAQGIRDSVNAHAGPGARARRGKGKGIVPAIPHPMTSEDIHEALKVIDTGRKKRHASGSTDIPTWYRAKE